MNKFLHFFICAIFFYNQIVLADDDKFYITALLTTGKIGAAKESSAEDNLHLSQPSKLSPMGGVGIGYYINDYSRVELSFENLNFNYEGKAGSFNYMENNVLTMGTKSVKRKMYGEALKVNYYFDVLTQNRFKFFIGAGVGVARIKEKKNFLISGYIVHEGGIVPVPGIVEELSSKKTNNFTYALIVGTAIKLMPQIHLDLMYSWRSYGRVRYAAPHAEKTNSGPYQGHHFSLGMRFSF